MAIDRVLTEIVSEGRAPGMIAAILSADGVLAIGSAGTRKAGCGTAMTPDDLMHLGSCTKAMTATMLATLVAEGKLRWDMSLVEALPELEGSLHPDFRRCTLWQLLTHRAGLPHNPEDWSAHGTREIKARRLAILKDSLSLPATFQPGEFHYSNLGYMVAACMAERVTSMSWESLMKRRIFDPLGMVSAGFGEPDAHRSLEQPWGHHRSGGRWVPSRSYDPEALGPAGEVHCTLKDWARFIALQLDGEPSILDRKSLRRLIEPIGFYAGGWGVSEHGSVRGKVITHTGSNGIWHTFVIAMPGLNRAYAVATNSKDFSSTGDTCARVIKKLRLMDSPP